MSRWGNLLAEKDALTPSRFTIETRSRVAEATMSKLVPVRLEQHRPEMQVRRCGVHSGGTFGLLSHRTVGVGQSLWFVPNRAFAAPTRC